MFVEKVYSIVIKMGDEASDLAGYAHGLVPEGIDWAKNLIPCNQGRQCAY